MSSDFWQATSTLVGACGAGGMIGAAAGTGILQSAPCTRSTPPLRLETYAEEFLRRAAEPVEQCVTIFGQPYSGTVADPYFQGTICGLIGLGIAGAVVLWQKHHP